MAVAGPSRHLAGQELPRQGRPHIHDGDGRRARDGRSTTMPPQTHRAGAEVGACAELWPTGTGEQHVVSGVGGTNRGRDDDDWAEATSIVPSPRNSRGRGAGADIRAPFVTTSCFVCAMALGELKPLREGAQASATGAGQA